jgi:hypothetical protein
MGLSIADSILDAWAAQNGLHVQTQHRDDEVRSIPVVEAGHEYQIWLAEDSGMVTVYASTNDSPRRSSRSWQSEPATTDALAAHLDAALHEIKQWAAETEHK